MRELKHIVLIDDNKIDSFINQKIIRLVDDSIHVKIFNSGVTALEFFKTSRIENFNSTDIILLDINMPVMSGFDLLNELSKIKSFIKNPFKVYYLSSSNNEQDINDALDIEYCSGYIIKPLTKEKIRNILEVEKHKKQKIIS